MLRLLRKKVDPCILGAQRIMGNVVPMPGIPSARSLAINLGKYATDTDVSVLS